MTSCATAEELALVGALLAEPSIAASVLEVVGPPDFTDTRLGSILAALEGREAVLAGELCEEMERRAPGQGWAVLLGELMDAAGVPAEVPRLARVVRRQALRRERERLLQEMRDGPSVVAARRLHDVEELLNGAVLEPHAAQRAVVVNVADVQAERVSWLWPQRIPLGKLSLVDGDPGLGKTVLLCDLAARTTTGRPMPDGTPSVEGGVVILTAEDGIADTIRPRLEAAGAKLERVVALPAIADAEGERLPEIPRDLEALREAVDRVGAVLVVIDPLMAFLGAQTNSYKDQDVRRALAPLSRLAEKTGAAVVCIRHLNKAAGGPALYRGGGSIGIVGAARAALLVARHPEDDERRVLAPLKSNLGPPPPSLGFRLVEVLGGAVAVDWQGEVTVTAGELLEQPGGSDERRAVDEAREWLGGLLLGAAIPAKDVQRQAKADGVSDATLRRAKKRLGVRSRRHGFGPGSVVVWELPDAQSP